MARYKVISEFFYHDQMQKVGTEIEFDGEPGENLEPIDDEAKARATAALERREKKRLALTGAASLAGGLSAEQLDYLTGGGDRLTKLAAEFESYKASAGAAVNTDNFATRGDVAALVGRVDALTADVAEHDVGLTLVHDRLQEVEGVIASTPKPADPQPEPPKDEVKPVDAPVDIPPSPPADAPPAT